ncbi:MULTISPECIES: cystatin-like fold lipoprotein [Staphylococcus]|uniref:cystatin-like fold lipoprotein n=1 Tax=Staphylococcus TaxID=1279 RepID=UPI000CD179FF|nr:MULTISPECIES: cystatin-like fold lipoprotein [Staphylococcus]MBY7663563.1 cystatin-like fold lipoprotein [Staphylococcus agnetis]MCR6083543.1 cystatin-like fold lipoprotein [Staphylococcus aureus]NJH67695.1 cystatin-like fold lipoprotein [Staphylococcus agnetis]NJH80168.1 cystatin-like fold lipoprotein [Staphylococcus agnetis]NVJ33084.1 cystatin-like fold lipoprotein [Staphylococcus aureus]
MKKLFLLFISSVFILSACGNKYDKEIEKVTEMEKNFWNNESDKTFNKFERNKANFKVYNDGDVITVDYIAIKGDTTVDGDLFKKNQSTGKYEKQQNMNVSKYQKNNKPDYEENNLKK